MNLADATAPDRAQAPAPSAPEMARRLSDALAPLCFAIAARLWMLGPFALILYFRLNRFRCELESLQNRIAAGAFALPPAAPLDQLALAPELPRETGRAAPRRETIQCSPRARPLRAASSAPVETSPIRHILHIGPAALVMPPRRPAPPMPRLSPVPRGPPRQSARACPTVPGPASPSLRRAPTHGWAAAAKRAHSSVKRNDSPHALPHRRPAVHRAPFRRAADRSKSVRSVTTPGGSAP